MHDVSDVADAVAAIARSGDVVLTLGAGSIGGVASRLVDALEKTRPVEHKRTAGA